MSPLIAVPENIAQARQPDGVSRALAWRSFYIRCRTTLTAARISPLRTRESPGRIAIAERYIRSHHDLLALHFRNGRPGEVPHTLPMGHGVETFPFLVLLVFNSPHHAILLERRQIAVR